MYQYYVQVIAGNYLKNLVDQPHQMQVHKAFLHADADDLMKGFSGLHETVRQIYSDVIDHPKEFDMLLKENEITDAKNADYTNSHASFIRLPNVLFLLGYKGEFQPDMTLRISGGDIISTAKDLKITKTEFFINKLAAYGFEISGMSKKISANDEISVSFPENRFVIAALKAMADAMGAIIKGELRKAKALFYMMDYRIMENGTPKEPKMMIDAVYHALDEDMRKHAQYINDFIVKYAKPAVRMGGIMRNDWSCVYTLMNNKKVILTINVVQDNLSVKLNLANINKYTDILDQYPEDLKEAIRTGGWECGRCHDSCAGGFAFAFEGKAYNKCRCGSFVFNRIDEATKKLYIQLLDQEISVGV